MSDGVLVIHTDGGSRGNPGPSAAAFWLPQMEYGGSSFLGTQTNNYAEYMGLILGLKEAESRHDSRVSVFTDSTLMANQVNGLWRVKSEELRPLWEEAQRRIDRLESFRIAYFPRELNIDADRLVNSCLDDIKDVVIRNPDGVLFSNHNQQSCVAP